MKARQQSWLRWGDIAAAAGCFGVTRDDRIDPECTQGRHQQTIDAHIRFAEIAGTQHRWRDRVAPLPVVQDRTAPGRSPNDVDSALLDAPEIVASPRRLVPAEG